MRLWHKYIISGLPREQLVAQWRECSAIAGNIIARGTPNHILVNKIMDYDIDHFITYSKMIREEMTRRGYRTMDSVWNKIVGLKPDWQRVDEKELFKDWMDEIYLKICFYNLYEKYLCGGITELDWDVFQNEFEYLMCPI